MVRPACHSPRTRSRAARSGQRGGGEPLARGPAPARSGRGALEPTSVHRVVAGQRRVDQAAHLGSSAGGATKTVRNSRPADRRRPDVVVVRPPARPVVSPVPAERGGDRRTDLGRVDVAEPQPGLRARRPARVPENSAHGRPLSTPIRRVTATRPSGSPGRGEADAPAAGPTLLRMRRSGHGVRRVGRAGPGRRSVRAAGAAAGTSRPTSRRRSRRPGRCRSPTRTRRTRPEPTATDGRPRPRPRPPNRDRSPSRTETERSRARAYRDGPEPEPEPEPESEPADGRRRSRRPSETEDDGRFPLAVVAARRPGGGRDRARGRPGRPVPAARRRGASSTTRRPPR